MHDDVIKWKHFFRVTGPLGGEFTGPRWIPLTKASDAELWCMFSLMCAGTNGWVNSREAGDLRRRRTHYDVTVMDVVLTISWHQVRCNDHVGLPSARILWIYIIVTIHHVHFYHDWLCHMINGRQFADGSFTYHFLMKLLYFDSIFIEVCSLGRVRLTTYYYWFR